MDSCMACSSSRSAARAYKLHLVLRFRRPSRLFHLQFPPSGFRFTPSPCMFNHTERLQKMDSQRFEISNKAWARESYASSSCSSGASISSIRCSSPAYDLSRFSCVSSVLDFPADALSDLESSRSSGASSSSAALPVYTYPPRPERIPATGKRKQVTLQQEVEEEEDAEPSSDTVLAILRPSVRLPLGLRRFARPAKPVISRPGSAIPHAALPRSFGCLSASAFEDELDAMLTGGAVRVAVRVDRVAGSWTEEWDAPAEQEHERRRRRAMEPVSFVHIRRAR
ncbi:unnamed protein product [Mycena citricolor]|uniref:Uncharacterized protein n=1 Tax=Mycena citricolor TaxID=2018698 RepID=A0AAD2HVK9_9AGAR|nr:unnamed protein product [Mycena citricolor]